MAPRSSAVFPSGFANGSTRVHSMCLRRPFESIAVSIISARVLRMSARIASFRSIVKEVLLGRVMVHDPFWSISVIIPSRVGFSVFFLWCIITFLFKRLRLFMVDMVGGSSFEEIIPIVSSSSDVITQVSSLCAAMAGRR